MDIKPGEITDILKREIKDYDREIDVAETGTVLSAGDGLARVSGLANALAGRYALSEAKVEKLHAILAQPPPVVQPRLL